MIKERCGFICSGRIFEYKGWLFEYNNFIGPWPLKKDLEPRKRAGKKFWNIWDSFSKLPENEKRQYLLEGGCVSLYKKVE
jgi:hypothetical protein